MHARLAKLGLVNARRQGKMTLRQLLDAFFQHLNVKPITSLGYQPTRDALVEHFGADTPIRDIEPLQADQWRAKMKAAEYAEATISKRVKLARQIFRQGVRWKMLSENPFEGVKPVVSRTGAASISSAAKMHKRYWTSARMLSGSYYLP